MRRGAQGSVPPGSRGFQKVLYPDGRTVLAWNQNGGGQQGGDCQRGALFERLYGQFRPVGERHPPLEGDGTVESHPVVDDPPVVNYPPICYAAQSWPRGG